MKRILITIISLLFTISVYSQMETADSIAMQELNEVVVNGEKPQINGHDGVMVVDLPNIVRDKPVTNILEALGYLPGVVNNDGAIGLNGAASVTIILNGEPTTMPLQNLYQLLYSTPVDRLKNVEIMYSAPAKYHVSGAVINVVLKTPRPLDGLMGQATLGYTQAHYASFSSGLNVTYAVKDWRFDLTWSLNRNQTYSGQNTFSNHILEGNTHPIEDDMRQIGRNWNNLIYATVSYKKLKLTYNGQITSGIRNESLSDGTLGDFRNLYRGLTPTGYHNVALRYESSFGLTLGTDFTRYNEHRRQNLFKGETEEVNSENSQTVNRWHSYLEQEHTLGAWTLGYGAEYQHSDDKSRQFYKFPENPGFDNRLREDVASVYISTRATFPWGLSFNTSVSAEYFHNDYQHNWNVIPQLGATFYKTPTSIFQLNFSTDRVYPSYWELHGGSSYINDYSMILGNPALQPYMNYSGQLSYILKQKYAATLYVLYADDYSVQLPYQSTSDLHLVFQTLNLDYSRTAGLQLHIPFDVKNIWNATTTLNIYHSRQKSTHFHDLSFDNRRWGGYIGLNNTIRFTPSCPVTLSVDASYMAGMIQGGGRMDPLWKIDAGVKWQFGMKRCCELNLKANDIFNSCNPILRINFSGQDYRLKTLNMNQSLNLTFVYRFNGFKPKEEQQPDTDISRFGTGN